jgi:hypothetical protein
VKLQSFFVLKFNSSKLRKKKNNITTTITNARLNNDLVRLSDNSLLRFIRRKYNKEFDDDKLKLLLRNQQKLRMSSLKQNGDKLRIIQDQIDSLLFVPEIIEVEIEDNRHYTNIITKTGLFVNGKRYVRLLASAGMARRSTVMFCQEDKFDDIMDFLECGRKMGYKLNPAKYNAYVALATSGGFETSIPYFVVVPDKEVEREVEVEWVSENDNPNQDPIIEGKTMQQTFNLFDGQGLMSRSYANKIADELELDYTPSALIFRGAWQKGLLVTFDFKELAIQKGINTITDIYGVEHYIYNVDVILSASQFKLSGAYENTKQYVDECRKNKYNWTIVRTAPKHNDKQTRATYQYLQILNLDDKQIDGLCEDTVDYFTKVSGMDWVSVIIFLLGSLHSDNIDSKWFHEQDTLIRALFYNKEILRDKYVQNKLRRMINKKIRESYEGKINIDGNYQFMISDPYAQCEHVFGLETRGLLDKRKFYSRYWNNLNVKKVSAIRSPCTYYAENNILDLVKSDDMNYWYRYLTTGIIYNIYDESVMLHGGSD